MMQIDLNCDLGEGMGNEEEIMPLISSCNIACGGHAGDEASMKQVVDLALQHHVAIGAHPSYPDKTNFGRVPMDISIDELKKSLTEQINSLKAIADSKGAKLHHVKPHGALYNQADRSKELATSIVEVIEKIASKLMVYGMPGSALEKAAQGRIAFAAEAFLDRRYDHLTQLTSRDQDGVVTDTNELESRLENFLHGYLVTGQGVFQHSIQTICVHSDSPKAVEMIQMARNYMDSRGITLQAP